MKVEAPYDTKEKVLVGYWIIIYYKFLKTTTKNIHGIFWCSFKLQINYDLGNLIIHILQARNLVPRDNNGYSDPFVKVYLLPGRGWVKKQCLLSITLHGFKKIALAFLVSNFREFNIWSSVLFTCHIYLFPTIRYGWNKNL